MGINYSSQEIQQEREKEREKEIKDQKRIQTINQDMIIERLNTSDNFNKNDLSQMGNTNDDKHQYKNILKTLYKNNLTSLTYEDMNAYFIQMNWKHLVISRNYKARKGIIDVIYSSIESESNSVHKRFIDILDIKEYMYRCYDLTKYKGLRKIVKVCYSL